MYFQDSIEKGKIAEKIFKLVANNRNWDSKESSHQENIHKHWDFELTKKTECKDDSFSDSIKVDVKSLKKINRTDSNTEKRYIWLELHGTTQNNKGWIYDGESDFVAFETIDSFVLVSRLRLIDFIEKNIDKTQIVKSPLNALYKIYNRKQFEEISLVELSKIRNISYDEWKKDLSLIVNKPDICTHLYKLEKNKLEDLSGIFSNRIREQKIKEYNDSVINFNFCPLCGVRLCIIDKNDGESEREDSSCCSNSMNLKLKRSISNSSIDSNNSNISSNSSKSSNLNIKKRKI